MLADAITFVLTFTLAFLFFFVNIPTKKQQKIQEENALATRLYIEKLQIKLGKEIELRESLKKNLDIVQDLMNDERKQKEEIQQKCNNMHSLLSAEIKLRNNITERLNIESKLRAEIEQKYKIVSKPFGSSVPVKFSVRGISKHVIIKTGSTFMYMVETIEQLFSQKLNVAAFEVNQVSWSNNETNILACDAICIYPDCTIIVKLQ